MNKEQARQLIKDTFEASFDKEKFVLFIRELLNGIDETKARHFRGYVKQAFKQVGKVIRTYERIGSYTEPSGKKIDILIVHLQKDNSLVRARATMRNFVAKYLKDRGEKDAALVAFVPPREEDWRFSLVKMDYRFEETSLGIVKVKEKFTPARRWSFLVGKNEKSHTAQSQLVKMLDDDENNPTLAQLEQAFNIETVTKEFFEKYRNLFIRTVDELDKIVENYANVRKDFESNNINTVDFAKKLLSQIVFLYFLQKKGWFGVKRDDKWGTGPKDFLRQLFKKKYGDYNNFFNDILESLFYEALARERDDNFYSRFNCKIPFLNGGLFEPIGNYNWVHTDIYLPDELFSNSYKTKEGDIGNGILDVFDRFNFTVKEDEPLEKEVAIDPELLGKLYEKFNAIRPDNFYKYKEALVSGKRHLEKNFNKKFGVYYTPREIVHYMCQESLINYLATELSTDSVIPNSFRNLKEDIEKFIKYGEQFAENEAVALMKENLITEGRQKSTEYEYKLPESIRENAKLIDEKLKEIKVCDPAIGSGAFPVGMMAEIVKTRNVLSPFLSLREAEATKQSHSDKGSHSEFISESRNSYNFKRDCIENCIYGVDIDPGAVEIAKLRLWLSLVVDEGDIKQIKPLPNLDYKIVCGNSLLGVEKNLFNNELFVELEKLKPLYFSETNPDKKKELKNQIEKLISKITNGHKEFDFEVYFSEVFHKKGGFDVVIANPPYVAGKSGAFNTFEKQYFNKIYEVAEYQLDTYILFSEKGLKICRKDGVLTYIMPNTWLANLKLIKIRKFLLDKSSLLKIVTNPDNTFETAVVDTIILITRRGKRQGNKTSIGKFLGGVFQESNSIDQNVFYNNEKFIFDVHLDNYKRSIISKIESKSIKVRELCYVNRGVHAYRRDGFGKSKFGKGFQTERDYKERSYHSNKKLDSTYYKEVRGKNVFPYFFRLSNVYISWGNWLAEPREWKYFTGERIYLRKIVGKTLYAAYVNNVNVADQSVYIAKVKDKNVDTKFLLSLFNSRLLTWYFRVKANEFDELFPQIKVTEFKELPVIVTTNQKLFITIVDRILAITKDEDYLQNPQKQEKIKTLEREIDQMVYKLYGLIEEEIKIVENYDKK